MPTDNKPEKPAPAPSKGAFSSDFSSDFAIVGASPPRPPKPEAAPEDKTAK